MRLTLALLLCPAALAAQTADSARGIPIPTSDSALRIPVDRPGDLLPWIPGGSIDPDGRPTWRGRSEVQLGRTIDGVYWGTVVRPQSRGSAEAPRVMAPAFNALGASSLLDGAYDVAEGPGGEGMLRFTTRSGGDRWVVRGTAESGSLARTEGGDPTSRFEAAAGGPLRGGWRIRAAATVVGREAASAGVGYGGAPYFAPVAIDTTFTYGTTTPGDTISVPVQGFAAVDRTPTSPRTTTDLAARLDGAIGSATVWAHYLRATEAERLFSYVDQSDPFLATGRDGRSQDLSAGITLAPVGPWHFAGQLSWQEEQTQAGPIDPATQLDSRSPALGILTSGVGLRYTLDNFPVDEQLVWNWRLNLAGSRRTPYDLENTDQYRVSDAFRNNAYGVLGFAESGGPVGTLSLFRDQRIGGQVRASRTLGTGRLTVGLEARHHDIASYTSALVNQASSDVWIAKPVEQGAFASWSTGGATWAVTAGLRLDRFNTESRRPSGFPRISSINYPTDLTQKEAWWDSISTPDRWHSAVSPRVQAEGIVGQGVRLHGSAGRLAQLPDLGQQLQGINMDLAITNPGHPFGTDYGYEITDLLEGGIGKRFGIADAEVTLFGERHQSLAISVASSEFDPLKLQTNVIIRNRLHQGDTQTGATLTGSLRPGPVVTLRGSYTYITSDADFSFGSSDFTPARDSLRHHTLVLMGELHAPDRGPLVGLGAVVSYRRASGTARPIDPGFGPLVFGIARSKNMPAWSSVDLRVTKSFAVGDSRLAVYLDARNLFNAEDLLRAFWSGNPKSSPGTRARAFSADSSAWSNEANNNGVNNNGDIDLRFGGAGKGGCGSWVDLAGNPSPPNCGYLINAEARFGNGNGIFTVAEQSAASRAYYLTRYGPGAFNGPPRAIRIGAQVGI